MSEPDHCIISVFEPRKFLEDSYQTRNQFFQTNHSLTNKLYLTLRACLLSCSLSSVDEWSYAQIILDYACYEDSSINCLQSYIQLASVVWMRSDFFIDIYKIALSIIKTIALYLKKDSCSGMTELWRLCRDILPNHCFRLE